MKLSKKNKSILSFILAATLLAACFSGTSSAAIRFPLFGYDWVNNRPIYQFAYQNPEFVSGAGTNFALMEEVSGSDPAAIHITYRYYNMIENDYFKAHKDEWLLSAYNEFEREYETWKAMEDDVPYGTSGIYKVKKVYSADGTFKAFDNDYANPDKTVYLEIILNTADHIKDLLEDTNVTLLYETNACPCIVVRFTGDGSVFNKIINDPNVLFVAPAFGAAIDPLQTCPVLRPYYTRPDGIKAEDARMILRYSVGQDMTDDFKTEYYGYPINEKEFFTFNDLDFDGHVTAADARIALRIAVGLENLPVIDVDI